MKCSLVTPAVVALVLASCDNMNSPTSSGSFDPLRAPGSNLQLSDAQGPAFSAGQFVRTIMDNTTFFSKRPKGDVDADKLLARGTSMKVISTAETFVKVELDSGEVGFVPAIMLEDPATVPAPPLTANPGEIQVYPPVGTIGEPLPTIDPAGLPPAGAIPTVIDPEAPAVGNPVPPITPVTPAGENFAAPIVPKTEPAPLPPNDDDLKTGSGQ